MSVAAIIVAAGRGTRAGGDIPKQWQKIRNIAVAERTLAVFADHPGVASLVLVVHPDDRAAGLVPDLPGVTVVDGDQTRSGSVRRGLDAVPSQTTQVLIHDAARPLVSVALIDRVLTALTTQPGAAPALPVTDALWTGAAGQVTGLQDRAGLYRAQTPQGFHLAALRGAYDHSDPGATDDVAIARAAGIEVAIVPGDEDNIKITGPEDFARAEALLGDRMRIRTGNGYDVHRFGPGDHVWLCGLRIDHPRGLQGHSDADVGLHAITDAIYGALAEGDIGTHFPPSDPQWKGAESHVFLRHAAGRAAARGFSIGNIDCTLVCERPKIGPHQAAMRARVAEIAGLTPEDVSVKATTSERLGFTGREEGIAAIATVTLIGT